MIIKRPIRIVRYGVTGYLLFGAVCAILCSIISTGLFIPYTYIISSLLIIFTAYFCAYKRYKLNPWAVEISFIRQVIIDPTVMILSIPFLFIMMRPGVGDLSAFIFLAFSIYPYILTNKRISGYPEKRWSELTRFEKIWYGIGYFIMALLAFIAIVSFINHVRELISSNGTLYNHLYLV